MGIITNADTGVLVSYVALRSAPRIGFVLHAPRGPVAEAQTIVRQPRPSPLVQQRPWKTVNACLPTYSGLRPADS
jgi:hypothetical protein